MTYTIKYYLEDNTITGEPASIKKSLNKITDSAKLSVMPVEQLFIKGAIKCPHCDGEDPLCKNCADANDDTSSKPARSKPAGEANNVTKSDNNSNKEAIDLLKAVASSLDETRIDAEKAVNMFNADSELTDSPSTDMISKALGSLAASSLSRRARLDAAYKLGTTAGSTTSHTEAEPVVITDINVGVNKARPDHEPPIVPVRTVVSPNPLDEAVGFNTQESCIPCGYVYKSNSKGCPRCAQANSSEATPIWRR